MRFLRRVAFWFDRRRRAADLAAEIEHHRARTQAALEADGIPAGEAAARSRHAMGNVALAREDAREVWIAGGLERVWRDAVYGARALRREPLFAVTALITLTLGIATTTTVVTVVDSELWKPLPFSHPSELVAVHPFGPGSNTYERVSGPDYLDWQSRSRTVDYAGSTNAARGVLRGATAESVLVQPVTSNYFQVLQSPAAVGRTFAPDDERDEAAIVLSYRAWQRLFSADPGVVGRRLAIDSKRYAVVGVSAEAATARDPDVDAFVVLDFSSAEFRNRSLKQMNAIGRLRTGVGIGEAQAELQAIFAGITETFPEGHTGHGVRLVDLRSDYSANNWRPLYFFLGAACLVLLLSCANVANLLLARALRRQREFAIRGALGGGKAALARQLIVEGALLAVPSAAAGALAAAWALKVFVTRIPDGYLFQGTNLSPDGRIAAVVVALSAFTTIVLSLAPLVFAQRIQLNVMLAQGGRTAGPSPRQLRTRNALLVAQMTMTLVLLVGAGLFVTSFVQLTRMPLGFEPQDRISLRVTLSGPRYAGDPPARAFAARLLDRARATPGVRDAAVDTTSPLGSGFTIRFVVGGRPRPPEGGEPSALLRTVSADYFRTLGIHVVSGRAFTDADGPGAPRVAIVNRHLARRLFPEGNALGQELDLLAGNGAGWTRRPGVVQIVGVAENVKDVGMNEVDFNNLYLPFFQAPAPSLEMVVSTSIPAAQVAGALRTAAAGLDPDLPVRSLTTLAARVDAAFKGDRFNLALIGSYAAIAVLLAAVGIYGAMARAVQERTREFGVRLALGAPPAAILRSSVWSAARLGITAAALGLALALVIARLVGNALYLVERDHEGLLYGVTTTDPLVLASAAMAVVVVAAMSAVIPARQATKVDPLIALRSE